MRMTLSGAIITDPVVEVINTLQNFHELRDSYLRVIDELTRFVILNSSDDNEDESATMDRLHTLQQIRQDILTLSTIHPKSESEVIDESNSCPNNE